MLKQFRRTAEAVAALVIELTSSMLEGTSGVFFSSSGCTLQSFRERGKKHPLHSLL